MLELAADLLDIAGRALGPDADYLDAIRFIAHQAGVEISG
jgi:hypothetical protein